MHTLATVPAWAHDTSNHKWPRWCYCIDSSRLFYTVFRALLVFVFSKLLNCFREQALLADGVRHRSEGRAVALAGLNPVSYTHLTLPTILRV